MGSARSGLRSGLAGAAGSAIAVLAVLFATGNLSGEDRTSAGVSAAAKPAQSAAALADVYERTRGGVVLIDHRPPGVPPRKGPPRRNDGVATGSGFVIDAEGHIVTNHHIVVGRGKTTVRFDRDAGPVDATILGRDPATDLALVKIEPAQGPKRLNPLGLGDSGAVRVGDEAIVIGNPFGLERSLSAGVVSATDRRIDAPDDGKIANAVQTDAAINPGNSGGPLLDAAGRVIGVISQARGDGIGFAVPVDTLKRVVSDLRRKKRTASPRPRGRQGK